ncbi:Asp23/Gls24 family envelope stress response protein [Aerococcus suis]|uniref:Uncharacterized conserved protein YloU, alkaline shock protein (Asp23) family n=1 Tax=Aerococcus suis TaxID=371602 RepID=A0A1W1Y1P5_9LACT|nr:Asp23/Gls24 family envelope stress response protein [Aerococcus suis]MCI7240711.1 Asp23/Gls24 family envelope stress response protein [Aerococcus suis]MDD7757889.1 Asp23/Gls24 family envelope stress response protein [Aerococcus suis]MDY4646860.1 Asp23/Gls24 family envelope stress response protein [Aerococcus suis]SMC30055.1 Uncharacterized conserved protein YloU, alkaline shock protein (Asp23) family [Aerococcus suis]
MTQSYTNQDTVIGDIDISDQVIEGIAMETAKQLPGVATVIKEKNNFSSLFSKEGNVYLYEDGTEDIALDITVVLDYGVSVPNVCFNLQEAIIEQVLYMTDIRLDCVNITVADLSPEKLK